MSFLSIPRRRIPALSPASSEVEGLTEHFDTGNDGSRGGFNTDDFYGFLNLDGTTLNSTGSNGAAAGDGEHVFYRHKEGLIGITDGSPGYRCRQRP